MEEDEKLVTLARLLKTSVGELLGTPGAIESTEQWRERVNAEGRTYEPNATPIRMEGASFERMTEDLPIYGTALGAAREVEGEAIEQTTLNRAEVLQYAKRPVILNWTTGPGNMAHGIKLTGVTHVVTSKRFVDRAQVEVPGATFVFLEAVRAEVGKFEKLRRLVGVTLFLGATARRALATAAPISPHRPRKPHQAEARASRTNSRRATPSARRRVMPPRGAPAMPAAGRCGSGTAGPACGRGSW